MSQARVVEVFPFLARTSPEVRGLLSTHGRVVTVDTDQMTGTATIVLGAVAVIVVLTSFVGFCPLYAPFRLSTRKRA